MALENDFRKWLALARKFTFPIAFGESALVGNAPDGNTGFDAITVWDLEFFFDFIMLDAAHPVGIEAGNAGLDGKMAPSGAGIEGVCIACPSLAASAVEAARNHEDQCRSVLRPFLVGFDEQAHEFFPMLGAFQCVEKPPRLHVCGR